MDDSIDAIDYPKIKFIHVFQERITPILHLTLHQPINQSSVNYKTTHRYCFQPEVPTTNTNQSWDGNLNVSQSEITSEIEPDYINKDVNNNTCVDLNSCYDCGLTGHAAEQTRTTDIWDCEKLSDDSACILDISSDYNMLPPIEESRKLESQLADSGYSGSTSNLFQLENNNSLPNDTFVNYTDDLKSRYDAPKIILPEPDHSGTTNDLDKLKKIAIRLKLQTRLASYSLWQDKISDLLPKFQQSISPQPISQQLEQSQKRSEQPKRTMSESLQYLRKELMDLRQMDEDLSRQFISLRQEIQNLRLQQSTESVEEMVDEAKWSMMEEKEFELISDQPQLLDKSPLMTVGVTKMNLNSRRFSVF